MPKNKNQTKQSPPANDTSFVVMPSEFRKAPPKKPINKKFIFIGAGALVVIIAISIGAYLVFRPAPQQIVQVPETSKTPEQPEESETSETPTPTTTPEAPSLTQPATTTPEQPEEEPEPISPGLLTQGTDNDADGLTEKEEAIFQTDSSRPDTDADGFLDGNEVFHLYNPSAIAPVGLLESGIVKLYRNASEGYSIFYPALWATSSTSDTSMVSFLADGSESFNITIKEASPSITLRSWYLSEFPDRDINLLQSYVSKGGYRGLQDSNRLNTYIKQGGKVFIINYDLGGTTTVWYRRVYDMVLNSLTIE